MGNLIAVGNLKGGTGKSTIAVNLACALAADERKVALVDADGQGTATDWHAGHRLPVRVEPWPLGGERDAQKWVQKVLTLKAAFDHVVVDLPPQVGSGIASALLLADLFVIPVTPSGVDLRATGKALELLRRARAVRGTDQPACLLVPSRVDRRTAIGRRIQATLERFSLRVGPAIPQRAAHVEAFDAGAWVGAHAPNSPAHREVLALKKSVLELFRELRPTPAAGAMLNFGTARMPPPIRVTPSLGGLGGPKPLPEAAGA